MFKASQVFVGLIKGFGAIPCVLCGGKVLQMPLDAVEAASSAGVSKANLVFNPSFCCFCTHNLPYLNASGCPQCAIEDTGGNLCGVCIAHPPKFAATTAAFRYQFPLDRLVQDFKFNANFALLELFANALADRILTTASPPDIIIPVPLSRQRLATRGFNQSVLLAEAVAKILNMKLSATTGFLKTVQVKTQWLEKLRDTPAQAGLALDARRRNIRGAFTLSAAATSAIAVQPNLKIALLDDVMTTGATLSEAAKILKQAGASKVMAMVVARVPPPKAKTQLHTQNNGNLIV